MPTTQRFQCAITHVYNVNSPHLSLEAVILFDTGAQRSFIHKSFAKALRLRPDFKEVINMGVFGQLSPTPKRVSVSRIGVKIPSSGDEIQFEVSKIDHIMGDIVYYPVSSEDDPLISDTTFKGEPQFISPTIVIGIDYFWKFEPKVIRKLPNGYFLMKSLLGLHLCGRGRAKLGDVSSVKEIVAPIVTIQREDVQVYRCSPEEIQYDHRIELTHLSNGRHTDDGRDSNQVEIIKAQDITIERSIPKNRHFFGRFLKAEFNFKFPAQLVNDCQELVEIVKNVANDIYQAVIPNDVSLPTIHEIINAPGMGIASLFRAESFTINSCILRFRNTQRRKFYTSPLFSGRRYRNSERSGT